MFRRVTSSGRYIPEVDGLRFVAIVGVFFYHLRGYINAKSKTAWAGPVEEDWLGQLTHFGNIGVPLFFVLSGFILGLPFASHHLKGKEQVSLRAYFLRRLTRLEPPYLLSLTVFLVMLRVVNHVPWKVLIPGYISSIFYMHNIFGDETDVIQSVGWSLEVEVQFYLLAPLLAKLFAIRRMNLRRAVIVGLVVAIVVLQRIFITPESLLWNTLFNYLQYFLGGFLVTDIFLNGGMTPRSRPDQYLWDGIWMAGWLGVLVSLWRPGLALLTLPLLFPLIMVATFRAGVCRKLLSMPLVTAIGGMCYSIYLVHFQLISLLGRITKDLPFSNVFWINLLIQGVVVGLPVLLLSSLFFICVEKPCMNKNWPQELAGRWRAR